MFFNQFFKALFYIFAIILIFMCCCQVNFVASLYDKDDNALEVIFPKWDWGNPKFYLMVDGNGVDMKAPDDMRLRYWEQKLKKFAPEKENICKEKGNDSEDCYKAEDELEQYQTEVEYAKDDLKDVIAEKGEEIKLSRSYEREEFRF